MFDWLNSSVSIFLVLTLAGSALFIWRKRWLKTAYAESCKTFHAACTTSTRETPEAAWITALRASVARDAWKPGLKPSAAETRVQLHPSYCDVPGHMESAARRAADAENGTLAPLYLPSRDAPEPAEGTARRVTDPESAWMHCKPGDPKIAKLRDWLSKGKTLFTVIVLPPADHEWERIHEGEGVLEEVAGRYVKFRFHGANPWMFFHDFSIGYDRKRKRPLVRFRERP